MAKHKKIGGSLNTKEGVDKGSPTGLPRGRKIGLRRPKARGKVK